MNALPAPFTPEDCDLRGYEWMPLFGARLFSSNFEAHASDLAFRVAIKLYWECWQQVPAASLPNDDVALCRLAGLGRDLKLWRRLRADGVLHGFIHCSDDRLYHGMLAEEAIKAWESRRKQDAARAQTAERVRRFRERNPNTNGESVTRYKPPSNAGGNGGNGGGVTQDVTVARAIRQDSTVQDRGGSTSAMTGESLPRARARTPIPDDWKPGLKEVELGLRCAMNEAEIGAEAERMRDWAKAKGALFADWDARFRNWLRDTILRREEERRRRPTTTDDLRRDWNLPSFLAPTKPPGTLLS